MQITIELYGHLKTLNSEPSFPLTLQAGSAAVKDVLAQVSRQLKVRDERFTDWVAAAVGDELVSGDYQLQDGDVLSLLPPVSGG